jgi:acetyl-CoA carboxylase biotin carboxyl carrier protein
MSKHNFDSELVRSLAQLLDENKLTEIEYEAGGLRLRVARNLAAASPVQVMAPAAQIASPSVAVTSGSDDYAGHPGLVASPMVGVVYFAPEPGAPAFVKVGDQVSQGQTLVLVEAMKTFNPIRAPRAGKITRIIVADAQPVEFGEPLLIIE